MANDLNSVLLGNVLSVFSRSQLRMWTEANPTARERLHANLPAGRRAADKTGSNGEHTSSDIAVIWPAAKPAIVVAAYITQCFGPESQRSAMLAEIGRMVAKSLAEGTSKGKARN
jgi:beta-lactamase class A